MRTKLFLAFIALIIIGLLSTMLFAFLIIKDFDDYVSKVRDDQVYWIVASVEGSYRNGGWNNQMLSESIHWALMMGLDIKVLDEEKKEIVHAHHVMESLSPEMKQRMEELFLVHADTQRSFEEFPILQNGEKVGVLLARSFQKKKLSEKEAAFKGRVRYFLYSYLLIAGAGLIFTGLFLTYYLSRPVLLLKRVSEKVAEGDFSARVEIRTSDEVGDLAKTFNNMAESLQREEALRKHLMSNIAHELRTPLTIMKTQAEAMSDGIVTDTRKGLDHIEGEIERLISLVKGIEDVTAAEAGFFVKGAAERINLKEFLSGLVDEMQTSFQNRGLFLTIAHATDLITTVDIQKLDKILRNIFSNALKFTDSGGVSIDYGVVGDLFFIELSDTGRGISPQDMPHIFDRFYRSADTKTEGLGLGLAIVKELVTIMDGKISATSELGKGTCFRVTLPFAP